MCARKSRTGVGRQQLPQPLSQHDGAQQAEGAPQAGSQQADGAPQAGSAAAQVASQQLGWQQPPPSIRSSRPAFRSAVMANMAATANKATYIRDFMGRTPVPVGKRTLPMGYLGCSFARYRPGRSPGLASPYEVRVLRAVRPTPGNRYTRHVAKFFANRGRDTASTATESHGRGPATNRHEGVHRPGCADRVCSIVKVRRNRPQASFSLAKHPPTGGFPGGSHQRWG